ncbi:MAG: tRNA glutamyl-Q(34) synthetase GluQRS [Burkholderiales bacterium]|nr:tRNA glutamyl-Q(34) synthetase GluQRS [Burkholderiales bacterium]
MPPERTRPYVGRFAPSPTGPLHFGSLVAAAASWLDARAAGGRWHVRIEDLDRARERPGAADTILRQLEALGLVWDGAVVRQSERLERYRAALAQLQACGAAYWCGCTRREIGDSALAPEGASVYPGTCRAGLAAGRKPRAVRVRTAAEPIAFVDRVQGAFAESVERAVGDFVVYRADGVFAYQLAVVVDDAAQGVTDVVRGADLLDSTARQIHLQRLLELPRPRYLHVPVAVDAAGRKLAKRTGAPAAGADDLRAALAFLGHAPPRDVGDRELLEWARRTWNPQAIPRARALSATAAAR